MSHGSSLEESVVKATSEKNIYTTIVGNEAEVVECYPSSVK